MPAISTADMFKFLDALDKVADEDLHLVFKAIVPNYRAPRRKRGPTQEQMDKLARMRAARGLS